MRICVFKNSGGFRLVCSVKNNEKGQTVVEYLLLLSVTFIVAYIMITRPLAEFTTNLLDNITSGIGNLVHHAEWTGGEISVNHQDHPANPVRLRALHL